MNEKVRILWVDPVGQGEFFSQVKKILTAVKRDDVEIDVTRDRAAAERVRGWANGYQTTPTFNIRGQIIVNFKRKEVADALGVPLPDY